MPDTVNYFKVSFCFASEVFGCLNEITLIYSQADNISKVILFNFI